MWSRKDSAPSMEVSEWASMEVSEAASSTCWCGCSWGCDPEGCSACRGGRCAAGGRRRWSANSWPGTPS